MSDTDESGGLKPRFELAEGKGTPLGELPCFTTVGTRGAAAKTLEAALEPLHRFVYGRPGVGGTRRAALESFQGFPAAMDDEVRTKLKGLVKAKLRDLVVSLGMGVHVSLPVEQLADGVADFLMTPKDNGKIKPAKGSTAAKKAGAKTSRASTSTSPSPSQPPAKRAKTEAPTAPPAAAAPKPSAAKSKAAGPATPSDEAVQVRVYQRVLHMGPEEREALGVKALRRELEDHFSLKDGDLKDRKDIIAAAASECVRALLEAERRAFVAMDPASSAARPPIASPNTPAEPTPSPVPPPSAVQDLPMAVPMLNPAPYAAPATTPYPHQPL